MPNFITSLNMYFIRSSSQVANVAPLAYTVVSTICPRRTIERCVIYLIITTGAISCLLLAFLWDKTSTIAGTEHSTALFVLQFFLALVDCTSSVAFLPFMSIFKPQYMTAYFIGEGFSGLIPSLVALGQGAGSMKCVNVSSLASSSSSSTQSSLLSSSSHFSNAPSSPGLGLDTTHRPNGSLTIRNLNAMGGVRINDKFTDLSSLHPHHQDMLTTADPVTSSFIVYPQYQPPKFTVQVFFLILMGLLILSALSFTLLNYWSYCKMQYAKPTPANIDSTISASLWPEDNGSKDWDTDASTMCTTPISSSSSDGNGSAKSKYSDLHTRVPNIIYCDPNTGGFYDAPSQNGWSPKRSPVAIKDSRLYTVAQARAQTQALEALLPSSTGKSKTNEGIPTDAVFEFQCQSSCQSSSASDSSKTSYTDPNSTCPLIVSPTSTDTSSIICRSNGGNYNYCHASSDSSSCNSSKKSSPYGMSKPKYLLFMGLTAWLCALSNGILPAVQTYSCLPYGIRAYHLSATLANIANPVACFATFFFTMTSVAGTCVTSLLGTALSAFILYTAATSPDPPLVDHSEGSLIIVSGRWIFIISKLIFLVNHSVSFVLNFTTVPKMILFVDYLKYLPHKW